MMRFLQEDTELRQESKGKNASEPDPLQGEGEAS